MTLNTKVRVLEPVPVRPLAEALLTLVGGGGELDDCTDYVGNPALSPGFGVGNDAYLRVAWGGDGLLKEAAWGGDDDYDPPPAPPAPIEITFDTAYGYSGPQGETCSALHARYIVHIAGLLPSGVGLQWQNEYSGEWHPFEDTARLAEFAGYHGANVSEWFGRVMGLIRPEATP